MNRIIPFPGKSATVSLLPPTPQSGISDEVKRLIESAIEDMPPDPIYEVLDLLKSIDARLRLPPN